MENRIFTNPLKTQFIYPYRGSVHIFEKMFQPHSHTSFPYSIPRVVTGGIYGIRSSLRLLGKGIGLVWRLTRLLWFWISIVWYGAKALFFWWLFLVLIWDFTDLLGIPLVQDLKKDIQAAVSTPLKPFTKQTPAETGERIKEEERRVVREWAQAHCRHITRRNGLWNYFCPLCGKKLIDVGDPPMWQI